MIHEEHITLSFYEGSQIYIGKICRSKTQPSYWNAYYYLDNGEHRIIFSGLREKAIYKLKLACINDAKLWRDEDEETS